MKILCPDGTIKTPDELKESDYYPKPILAKLIGRERKKKPKTDKPWFGVTRLTSCLRKTYFDLTEEVPMPLEKLWIFARGHAIHNLFQEDLPKQDIEVFKKKEFSKFGVLAYIDAIHEDVLYELKTTANIPEGPQDHHVLQSQAYFSLLSKQEQEKIKKIVLVYFSLRKIKHFDVAKRDVTHCMEARGTILAEALKHGVPPNKEDSWLCNYCEYKEFCNRSKPTTYNPKTADTDETGNKNDEPNGENKNLNNFF